MLAAATVAAVGGAVVSPHHVAASQATPAAASPSSAPTPCITATPLQATPTPYAGGIVLGPSFCADPSPEAAPTPLSGTTPTDSPGFFDIGGHVRQAIDDWFRNLVQSALDPMLTFLGQTILATPNIADEYRVHETWGAIVVIANALLILFVLVGAAIVMGHETVQSRYSVKEVAPRLVLGAVAANVSLTLVGVGIHFANALSQAFLGQGVDPVNATAAIRDLVLAPVATGGIFIILLGLVVAVVALVLLVIYIARVSLLVIVVVAGPLALMCHALPQTEGIAQLWWRAVLGLLAVQIAQALVLVTALRVFFDSGHHALGFRLGGSIIDMLLCLCLLWVLMRIPAWISRFVFSGRRNGSTVGRVVKYAVIYKLAKAVGL